MSKAAAKKIIIAAALATAFALGGCGDRANSPKKNQVQAAQYSERADSYRRQGQYRAAVIEARNAIKAAPQDPRNNLLLARVLNEIGQFKLAVQTLEPYAQTGDADIAIALTTGYIAQKKYQTASDYLQSQQAALKLDTNPELKLLNARALAGAGHFDAANAILQSLQNDPQFATRAALESARNIAAQGDSAGAMTLGKQILQRAPKDVETMLFVARLAEQGGDLAQAEDLLGRALIELPQTDILTPTKISVLETLSSVVTKLGRSGEALVYSKALADADPDRMRLQEKFNRGLELFQSGKLAEAEPLLAEVYEQSKNDSAGILLGMIKYANNDLAGADKYLSSHIDPEVAPDAALMALAATDLRNAQPAKLLETFGPEQRARIKNPQLKALVGIALLDTGKTDEGEKMVAQALAEQPDNLAIATTLARHYLAARQTRPALELLQKTQAAHPQNESVNRLLISTYLALGDSTKALELARKFAAQKTEKAENFAMLGHTALLARQFDTAMEALQKALTLDPKFAVAQFDLAQIHLLQKRATPAIALFTSILQNDADNIDALKGLITARELAQGREATAAKIETEMPGIETSPTVRAVVAEYYLRNNRIGEAERLLQTVETTPSRYTSYVRQLLSLARAADAETKRDFASARNELVQALRANPQSLLLLTQLARLELHANAPQEASKVVAQIEALQPQSSAVEELKADIAAVEKRWPDAIARYRALWRRQPGNAIGGKLYRALQTADATNAAKFLDDWKTQVPASAAPFLLQGMTAEQHGDNAAAIRAYEAGLARDGNNVAALNNLALLYLQTKDARARERGAKAYQLQPRSAAVLDTYGWILAKTGDVKKGLELVQQAQSLAPDSREIAQHLAEIRQLH